MKDIYLHDAAKQEMKEAARFYESRRDGLGDEFLDELEASFSRIKAMPLSFPSTKEVVDYRKCLVKRFPYLIFFKETDEVDYVVAIAHCKRKPGYWNKRS